MNWNKLIVISSIAFALAAASTANAQRGARGPGGVRGGGMGRAHFAAPSARSIPAQAGRANTRVNANRTGILRNGSGRGGRWGNHRWHHRRWHRGYYPYYAYYPYGYPFWGTSFYFNDYDAPYYATGSGSIIVDVQQQLAEAGYYRGAIDGILGNGTRDAIRRYKRAHRLPVDGRIDADLLATMGVG